MDKQWLNNQINMMLAKKYSQPMTPQERVKGGASALPVIGDAISGYDAYQSAKQGDYLGAALNAVGMLPLVPGLAGTIKSKTGSIANDLLDKIKTSEDLKQWASKSKVVDKTGNPLTVYHGTHGSAEGFDRFDPNMANTSSKTGVPDGSIFFSSSPDVASSYTVKYQGDFGADYKDFANVRPHHIALKKPLVVNAKGESWRDILYKGEFMDINELAKIAKDSGKYDGVIVKNVFDHGVGGIKHKPSTTYAVFDPDQIKSAIGTKPKP